MEKVSQLYTTVYGKSKSTKQAYQKLEAIISKYKSERTPELRLIDTDPTWVYQPSLVGMTLYVDLFSKDFTTLIHKIDYLLELGISFVHLMPLLKPRPGENDGGYAVMDYTDVDPNLGTLESFKSLLNAFRENHIYVCIDYVINHIAKEHIWAQKALKNDPEMQSYFIMYDTDEIPNLYNQTVPEVLPDKCPGNFTFYEEIKKYVFTSFSEFQWDLNFANPLVFNGMVEYLLNLANLGVNMIRLDAIPFMWKTLGTSCRNLPTIHLLLEMIHHIKEDVCPSVALLGEAIVEPHEVIKYFGTTDSVECEVMYNANLMVNLFNAFATRDTRLIHNDINEFRIPNAGSWMNYIRCHDDIGWGFNEAAIQKMGFHPYHHKQFLISFYNGSFEGSFAKGEDYQYNPVTHDARTNGTLASLLGLEKALDENDVFEQDTALKRIHLANAIILFYRGFPLIYSGDEIATLNDQSYLNDSSKAKEGRWVHRPYFNWDRAEKRHRPYTHEYEVFQTLKHLIHKRKSSNFLDGRVKQSSVDLHNSKVLCIVRHHSDGNVIGLFNFSEYPTQIETTGLKSLTNHHQMMDTIHGRQIDLNKPNIHLSAYEYMWLVQQK